MKTLSLMILIFGGALAIGGCGKNCGYVDCISPGLYVYTPTGLPSPLVDVTADSPCDAQLALGDAGPPELTVVDNLATQGSVCTLHGHLADGRVVTATVTFGQPMGTCCVTFKPSGGDFTVADAGTDGG